MSNIFSFERFVKVLKYDLVMRVPAIGVFFLVLLIMPHALHLMMDFGNNFSSGLRLDMYSVMCVFVIFFAPFKIYTAFRGKQELGSYIMLPASSLEKYVSMVLVSLILVPGTFILCTCLLDVILCLLFSGQYDSVVAVEYKMLLRGAGGVFVLTSAAVLGNTLFKKGAPAKTLLCILILVFLWLAGIAEYMVDTFLEASNVDADAEVLQIRGEMIVNISTIVYFAVAILFYILTWWRVRKIQIS